MAHAAVKRVHTGLGDRVGDRSRGRYATPAGFPLQVSTSYRGLRVRRWGLGFVHRQGPFSIAACQNLGLKRAQPAKPWFVDMAATKSLPRVLVSACHSENRPLVFFHNSRTFSQNLLTVLFNPKPKLLWN
jgi:hypothetical protein